MDDFSIEQFLDLPDDDDAINSICELEQWIGAGYSGRLIPLFSGDKKPKGDNWQARDFSDDGLRQHAKGGGNIGLRLTCREPRLVVIEAEHSAIGQEIFELIRSRFPNAPERSREGSTSRCILMAADGPVPGWSIQRPASVEGDKRDLAQCQVSGQLHIVGTRDDRGGVRVKWNKVRSVDRLPRVTAGDVSGLLADLREMIAGLGVELQESTLSHAGTRDRSLPHEAETLPIDVLQEAVRAIPRDGAFDSRERRVAMMHAIAGSSGKSAEGRELWLEWDASEAEGGPGNDPERAAEYWDRLGKVDSGAGFLRQELERLGRLDIRKKIAGARAVAIFSALDVSNDDDAPAAGAPPTPAKGLADIPGGSYPPREALRAISARFALVDRDGEVSIVHRTRDQKDEVLARDAFNFYLANVFVEIVDAKTGEIERIPAAKWWMTNPQRPPVRRAIFEPRREARQNEYNFWRGFGVSPLPGRDKIRRMLNHIWTIICRRDRRKYRYVMRYLAWAVQNPEKHAETVLVFKSEGEGSGKSTVSDAMRIIFGNHAAVVSDPEHLIGSHVDNLEFACFVQIEEGLFAGDPRTADRMKHAITGSTLRINPKHKKAYLAPNRMAAILTTNHDWSVPAGKNARRWFVLEVDEEKIGDRAYFVALYRDLEAGGYGQLLNYLQSKKLGGWHPRDMPRTRELGLQQIMSASGVHKWLLSAAEDGHLVEFLSHGGRSRLFLNQAHTVADLYNSYADSTKQHGGRVETKNAFGRTMTRILGENSRVKDVMRSGASAGRGYFIPNAETLAATVEAALGIEERITEAAPEPVMPVDDDEDLEDLPL